MRWFLFLLAFVSLPGQKVADSNAVIEEINEAIELDSTQLAIGLFAELIDSMQYREPAAVLNGANFAFEKGDTTNARAWYQLLAEDGVDTLRSQAHLQLGLLDSYSQPKNALEHFKSSLRANPENKIAKYNYELLKRYMDRQNEQQEKDEKPEPSAYAKWLKEQADALVRESKFGGAFQLMSDGLKQDMTVQYYQDFIKRLEDISTIADE